MGVEGGGDGDDGGRDDDREDSKAAMDVDEREQQEAESSRHVSFLFEALEVSQVTARDGAAPNNCRRARRVYMAQVKVVLRLFNNGLVSSRSPITPQAVRIVQIGTCLLCVCVCACCVALSDRAGGTQHTG